MGSISERREEKGKVPLSIVIKPFSPGTHPNQDGAHIDLGLRMIVEDHDQPFELLTQATVAKGENFRIETSEGAVLFDSKSVEANNKSTIAPSVEPSS